MSAASSEFSRLVPLARIGAEPFRQEIAATEQERAALARRFDLISLNRLVADVELARRAGGMIRLRAAFEAEFEQSCVASLDPVPGAVSESFELLYGPPEMEASVAAGAEDVAFEPLESDVVDVGEAVAQEFSLVLPAFPRSPEATVETEELSRGDVSPFAALPRLSGRERGE